MYGWGSIQSISTDVIEAMLPTWSGDQGLHVIVQANVDSYGDPDGDDAHLNRLVEVLFHRPNNYTKVYVRVGRPGGRQDELAASDWTLASNHDSCWRTDGLNQISKACFALRQELPHKLRAEASESICFHFATGAPRYVTIEKAEATDTGPYPKNFRLTLGPGFDLGEALKQRAKSKTT